MLIAGFIFADMRYHSYLNSAKKIIESYKGNEPFSIFLKKYFGANKKHGSKDRKQIAALCYNFYRLGKAMPQLPAEEKIIVATFLCEDVSSVFLEFHKPEWNEIITKPFAKKTKILSFKTADVFPWADEISAGIDFEFLCKSFFIQPDLFIRIRPGKKEIVFKKMQKVGLPFKIMGDDCIALPNSTRLDALLEIDIEIIVQDYNSQQVLNSIRYPESSINNPVSGNRKPVSVWDCCAASGGKSILLFDILKKNIELTVSDIRLPVLLNLHKRFTKAGIKNYNYFIGDLSTPGFKFPPLTFNNRVDGLSSDKYKLIICDAPCTGSGTWSRTPEQLYFFNEEMIAAYAAKQKKIVDNIIPHLLEGGLFIYITCSVFKKENEEMVNYIKEKFHLQLLQMELLKGFDKKADSMFVAVFIKK